jgi:hypothetical protein
MKGNFHVQFGIGGGEGDFIADHTKVGIGTSLNRLKSKVKWKRYGEATLVWPVSSKEKFLID